MDPPHVEPAGHDRRISYQGELQFRQLLEHLPMAAYTCDTRGLITFFNRQAVQLWGREPRLYDETDRFCGSFKLYSTDGAPIRHDECWMALSLVGNQQFNGKEILIERPDGNRVTVLAHANPLHDETGKLVGAVNVLVDVSDHQRTAEAQSQLAAIIESSEDAIISKTFEGRITSWNRGAQRLFGYTAEEAIGSPITLIIPPERRDEEHTILARLRRGERIEHYETVRVSKHGERLDISLSISPIRDAQGRVVGAAKVARDISARKQRDRALVSLKDELASQLADLRRLHAMSVSLSKTLELQPILEETLRTAAAISGTDMGVLSICDPEHNDLRIGASLGFKSDFLELVERLPRGGGACGMCCQEKRRIIVEDVETDPLFADYREAARLAGFCAVHSTPLITRSGQIMGVLSTHFARPHRPSDREIHLVDLCARQAVDFIENARLYTQLRDNDRLKDHFLATLAHELRNPLAPISNSLNLLRLSDDLSPTAEHVCSIMERQVSHMVRLVDDLLEVSRITRGKVDLRAEPVELVTIVGSAVETARPLVEAAGHQLAISLPPEPIVLQADPIRLTQVIANLLSNAAKYTEDGGQIWLTARLEGREAVVTVKDNGLGIPADMLSRVFDMFAQVDRTLVRSQGGLGIGLTLAKSLVELHGGSIEAHSEGLGKGSEFVVRLPAAPVPLPRVTAPHPASHAAVSNLPSRRILVVDDASDGLFILSKLLGSLGQQVRTANSAQAALEAVRSDPPDIVISDIAMPQMNGYELARQLRSEPALGKTVLIALTGYGQDSDRERALEAGFHHHLIKPIDINVLQELLASLPPPAARGENQRAQRAV